MFDQPSYKVLPSYRMNMWQNPTSVIVESQFKMSKQLAVSHIEFGGDPILLMDSREKSLAILTVGRLSIEETDPLAKIGSFSAQSPSMWMRQRGTQIGLIFWPAQLVGGVFQALLKWRAIENDIISFQETFSPGFHFEIKSDYDAS